MSEKTDKALSANTNGVNGAAEEKPVFDFSRTSYKDMRNVARLQMKLAHVKKRIDTSSADTDIEPLMDELDALINQQEAGVMKTVVSLPRSWLIADAPPDAEIEWKDPESLRWLRSNRFGDLVNMSLESRDAKN